MWSTSQVCRIFSIPFVIAVKYYQNFVNVGSKAVDALLNSDWSQKKGEKDPFFNNRQEIVNFMNKYVSITFLPLIGRI